MRGGLEGSDQFQLDPFFEIESLLPNSATSFSLPPSFLPFFLSLQGGGKVGGRRGVVQNFENATRRRKPSSNASNVPLDGVHRFQKGEGFVDRSFEGGKKETRKNTNLKRERGGLMKLAGWLDLPSFLSFSPRGRKSRRKTWSCTKFRKCYEEKKAKLECIKCALGWRTSISEGRRIR